VPSTTGATRLTVKRANLGTVKTDEHDALGLTPEQFDLALNVDKALLPNYLSWALNWKQYDLPSDPLVDQNDPFGESRF
jgi:hypothetical protein